MSTNAVPSVSERTGQFEDLQAKVGSRVQLVFSRSGGSDLYASTLIGYLAHEFVIVKAPVQGALKLRVQNDELLKLRLFTGVHLVEFDTSLLRQFAAPLSYWHLAYPAVVRISTLRAAQRVAVDLPVRVEHGAEPSPCDARLVDLNELGAKVAASNALGETGSAIRLAFTIPAGVNAEPLEVSVSAKIKAVKVVANAAGGQGAAQTFAYGVQFDGLDEQNKLILQNFVLLRLNDIRTGAV